MDSSTTLYIGHYLFGETAKRNTFMMKLNEEYQATSAFSIGTELPDNLAVVLRFLSVTHNEEFAMALIHDGIIPALDGLCKNLDKTKNPYISLVKSIQGFLSGIERETGMVSANV
jgi:nitrate reductase assembly molybdenum cofactor insertion protein NarJ